MNKEFEECIHKRSSKLIIDVSEVIINHALANYSNNYFEFQERMLTLLKYIKEKQNDNKKED